METKDEIKQAKESTTQQPVENQQVDTFALTPQFLTNPYHVKDQNLTLCKEPIDYYEVKAEYFPTDYHVTETQVNPVGQYLEHALRQAIDFVSNDTTVINAGVGQGKTYALHKFMVKYAKEGYTVIVASPFKALVKRDYNALIQNEGIKVINFEQHGSLTIDKLLDAQIHVMTINMLLRNSGESNRTQSKPKSDYLDALIKKCQEKQSKVILFLDEVHASINNFSSDLIKHLWSWNGLIHKTFLVSATFTEASIVVIKYFSNLTNKCISIFNSPRKKAPIQSRLHLCITKESYSHLKLDPLVPIIDIIEEANAKKRSVDILVGTKSLAKAIVDLKREHPLPLYLNQIDFNLTIGDNQASYNPDEINIGTTFGTGISIDDPGSVLIIVLPHVPIPTETEYRGIFYDGSNTITQAIARQRAGGDIYIFMTQPSVYIEGDSEADDYETSLPLTLRLNPIINKYKFKDQPNLVLLKYDKEKRDHDALEQFANIGSLPFPNLDEFRLNKSSEYLASLEPFGGRLSPYVLKASYTDQFQNATLESTTILTTVYNKLEITSKTIDSDLRSRIDKITKASIDAVTDPEALDIMIKALYKPSLMDLINSSTPTYNLKNEVFFNGRKVEEKFIRNHVNIMQALINLLYEFRHGEAGNYDLSSHVRDSIVIATSKLGSLKKEESNLVAAYKVLGELRQLLVQEVHVGKVIVDYEDVIDDGMLKKARIAFKTLKLHDPLISKKTYSLLQGKAPRKGNDWRIRKVLLSLFFDLTRKRSRKEEAKKIIGIKLIPSDISQVKLTLSFK